MQCLSDSVHGLLTCCAAVAVNDGMPIYSQLELGNAHLDIDTGRCVVLDNDFLKVGRCGPHCLDSHTAESCLHISQGVLSHQPHPVHYLVLQPLVHYTGVVCESLQRQDVSGLSSKAKTVCLQ